LPAQSFGAVIGTRLVTHVEAFRVRERTARWLNVLHSGSFQVPVGEKFLPFGVGKAVVSGVDGGRVLAP
jgi:hypothetical protein